MTHDICVHMNLCMDIHTFYKYIHKYIHTYTYFDNLIFTVKITKKRSKRCEAHPRFRQSPPIFMSVGVLVSDTKYSPLLFNCCVVLILVFRF